MVPQIIASSVGDISIGPSFSPALAAIAAIPALAAIPAADIPPVNGSATVPAAIIASPAKVPSLFLLLRNSLVISFATSPLHKIFVVLFSIAFAISSFINCYHISNL